MSLRQGSNIEVDVLWPCNESKWYGKGYDAGVGRGKKKRGRPMKRWMEEVVRMSEMRLDELRDTVKDRDSWRKLTMTIARALRVDSTR